MKVHTNLMILLVLVGFVAFSSAPVSVSARGSQEEDTEKKRGAAQPERAETDQVRPAISRLRTGQGRLRTAEHGLVLHHAVEDFAAGMMSGGPPPDGIPSIDDPRFIPANQADLDPDDKVIGLAYQGVVRAYPQRILVYHEIVNHEIGGENLAVTYCPLTATAQAFKTGSTTLGVSGQLVNSNLVMYDRDTGSVWPQIAATAIAGEHMGATLHEINVYWTTWKRWRTRYPETEVLSSDTGHLRDYNRDPYGSYNPSGGYYASDRTLFPLMSRDDRYPVKHMVVGGRTVEHAVFFDLDAIREQGVQATEHFTGVYDESLDTGYIYESRGASHFEYRNGQIVDRRTGEAFAPGELPLDQVVAVEAFYFAWNAFYPESEHP